MTSKFNSKAKGNKFEHKISKEISDWMFNDKTIIGKDPTSGARKYVYKGDIIPVKAHAFNWKTWPFLFELKHGYKEYIPTFTNFNKIKEWIHKLITECDENQYIPILICKFHHQPAIFITNHKLNNIYAEVIININYNNLLYPFYVYDYEWILQLNFKTTWSLNIVNHLQIQE